jgi:hypothetical protein
MAILQSTEDFRLAIAYLQSVNHFGAIVLQLNIGEIVAECEVLDDATLTDITPDTATLESALDNANAEITQSENVATEDESERATLLSQYNAAITQIGNDQASIANGKTAMQGVPNSVTRTVILGMLDVMEHIVNRDERELKALRAILRSGLL